MAHRDPKSSLWPLAAHSKRLWSQQLRDPESGFGGPEAVEWQARLLPPSGRYCGSGQRTTPCQLKNFKVLNVQKNKERKNQNLEVIQR